MAPIALAMNVTIITLFCCFSLSLLLAPLTNRRLQKQKLKKFVFENNKRERVRQAIFMSFQPCCCSILFERFLFFRLFIYFCPFAVLCPEYTVTY